MAAIPTSIYKSSIFNVFNKLTYFSSHYFGTTFGTVMSSGLIILGVIQYCSLNQAACFSFVCFSQKIFHQSFALSALKKSIGLIVAGCQR